MLGGTWASLGKVLKGFWEGPRNSGRVLGRSLQSSGRVLEVLGECWGRPGKVLGESFDGSLGEVLGRSRAQNVEKHVLFDWVWHGPRLRMLKRICFLKCLGEPRTQNVEKQMLFEWSGRVQAQNVEEQKVLEESGRVQDSECRKTMACCGSGGCGTPEKIPCPQLILLAPHHPQCILLCLYLLTTT